MVKNLQTEVIKASEIIQDGEWKAYKVVLNKWNNNDKNGFFMTIEKHEAKPNSLDKNLKSWQRKQIVTINNPEISDRLIEEIKKMSEELKSSQSKQQS